MGKAITLGAIDAGSNAIRLLIGRGYTADKVRWLKKERYAVRLGDAFFARRRLDELTIHKAVIAFRDIEILFKEYHVKKYRAVATSATRESLNRKDLIDAILKETEIELEVIDGEEEARLVKNAVLAELNGSQSPRFIFDLGGGSLDVSVLKSRETEHFTIPLGTVRLMSQFGGDAPLGKKELAAVEEHVEELLGGSDLARGAGKQNLSIACGGNAEALVRICPGEKEDGVKSIDLRKLEKMKGRVFEMGAEERMKSFEIRRDRAEVIGLAAVVLLAIGRRLEIDQMLVPGVGIREGILRELADDYFTELAEPAAV